MSTVETDPIVQHTMPLAKAVSFIKASRNRKMFLRVGQRAYLADKPDHYYEVSGLVAVKAPTAVKYLEDAYNVFDKRGAQVRLGVCSNCLFIG